MTWLRPLAVIVLPLSIIGWLAWQRIKRVLPPDPQYRYEQTRAALGRATRGPRVLP